MTSRDLDSVALTLVGEGKGILAADETIPTLTRFDARGAEYGGRANRKLFFISPRIEEFISGITTIQSFPGTPLTQVLCGCRVVAGIKVDTGSKPRVGVSNESRGGQSARLVTIHRNAVNRLLGRKPGKIRCSHGPGLRVPAPDPWCGQHENRTVDQQAFYRRASSKTAVSVGKCTAGMAAESPNTGDPPQGCDDDQ